jgi:hypothetical protein
MDTTTTVGTPAAVPPNPIRSLSAPEKSTALAALKDSMPSVPASQAEQEAWVLGLSQVRDSDLDASDRRYTFQPLYVSFSWQYATAQMFSSLASMYPGIPGLQDLGGLMTGVLGGAQVAELQGTQDGMGWVVVDPSQGGGAQLPPLQGLGQGAGAVGEPRAPGSAGKSKAGGNKGGQSQHTKTSKAGLKAHGSGAGVRKAGAGAGGQQRGAGAGGAGPKARHSSAAALIADAAARQRGKKRDRAAADPHGTWAAQVPGRPLVRPRPVGSPMGGCNVAKTAADRVPRSQQLLQGYGGHPGGNGYQQVPMYDNANIRGMGNGGYGSFLAAPEPPFAGHTGFGDDADDDDDLGMAMQSVWGKDDDDDEANFHALQQQQVPQLVLPTASKMAQAPGSPTSSAAAAAFASSYGEPSPAHLESAGRAASVRPASNLRHGSSAVQKGLEGDLPEEAAGDAQQDEALAMQELLDEDTAAAGGADGSQQQQQGTVTADLLAGAAPAASHQTSTVSQPAEPSFATQSQIPGQAEAQQVQQAPAEGSAVVAAGTAGLAASQAATGTAAASPAVTAHTAATVATADGEPPAVDSKPSAAATDAAPTKDGAAAAAQAQPGSLEAGGLRASDGAVAAAQAAPPPASFSSALTSLDVDPDQIQEDIMDDLMEALADGSLLGLAPSEGDQHPGQKQAGTEVPVNQPGAGAAGAGSSGITGIQAQPAMPDGTGGAATDASAAGDARRTSTNGGEGPVKQAADVAQAPATDTAPPTMSGFEHMFDDDVEAAAAEGLTQAPPMAHPTSIKEQLGDGAAGEQGPPGSAQAPTGEGVALQPTLERAAAQPGAGGGDGGLEVKPEVGAAVMEQLPPPQQPQRPLYKPSADALQMWLAYTQGLPVDSSSVAALTEASEAAQAWQDRAQQSIQVPQTPEPAAGQITISGAKVRVCCSCHAWC